MQPTDKASEIYQKNPIKKEVQTSKMEIGVVDIANANILGNPIIQEI